VQYENEGAWFLYTVDFFYYLLKQIFFFENVNRFNGRTTMLATKNLSRLWDFKFAAAVWTLIGGHYSPPFDITSLSDEKSRTICTRCFARSLSCSNLLVRSLTYCVVENWKKSANAWFERVEIGEFDAF
jgi:hypothetical protein